MAKNYYYDPETCDYVEIRHDLRYKLRLVALYVIVSSVLSVGIIALYYQLHDSPRTAELKTANTQLEHALDNNGDQIATLQTRLDSIQAAEQRVYRTALNAEPVEEANEPTTEKRVQEGKLSLEELEQELATMEEKLSDNSVTSSVILQLASMKQEKLRKIPAIRPVDGEVLSGFGTRKHPIIKEDRHHPGIDFKADVGTPVVATADGTVQRSGLRKNGLGLYVSIRHAQGYTTQYAHLSELKVHRGDAVERGDVIGYSGATGLCKGPHLHYRLLKNGTPIDPVDYFYLDLSPKAFMRFKKKASQYNESMN